MENHRTSVVDVTSEYHPIRSCDSDDSQSSASRSEDNEAIPGIIYTSDDSADVGQSDSASNISNFLSESGNRKKDDELSQQLLLESDGMADLNSSVQPSPQVDIPFVNHPLTAVNCSPIDHHGSLAVNRNPKFERNKVHLQVQSDNVRLTRSNSTSSSSMETEYTAEVPFLARYEPLSLYNDEPYTGGLNFNALKDDPMKDKVIHDQLKILTNVKEIIPNLKNNGDKFLVGEVPIDAQYRDAFFVKWNWPRIRQTCVFFNLSMLFGFLCVGVGLIIQMPKGSDCNPVQEWWQGSTSYHIFVPSFQDTDGNGFGDLNGVIERLDYLQGLGVKSVRLAPIFPTDNFLEEGGENLNYTDVSPLLGDTRDFHLLTALLHERDMFLILDIPLGKSYKSSLRGVKESAVDLKKDVPFILSHWIKFGVDGFAFTDLHKLDSTLDLIPALHLWRNTLDKSNRGLYRRVMCVPVDFLKKLEVDHAVGLHNMLHIIDLIDTHLDLTQPAQDVAKAINEATRWDNHPSLPWINWRIGGPFETRITDVAPEKNPGKIPALGFLMLQLFLPGSVNLYYGDEIGLTINESDFSWATPMAWSSQNGGFSKGSKLWLSLGEDWEERNVASMNKSLEPLRTMIAASQNEVPLYINGIFEDVGSFRPSKTSNYKIRYAADDLLIMDRFYPRRNKFAIVVNLGEKPLKRDLSKLYYGGKVLASSDDKEGYVRFTEIMLKPREGLALILDK